MVTRSMKEGLLVIGGGSLQVFALKRARELGIETYLADGSETCAARSYADHFCFMSTKDIEGMEKLAIKLSREKKISGVYTQGADVEYTVARAARAAGLPGIDPMAALNCNNKIQARKLLADAGISNIPFVAVKSSDEALGAIVRVGFPCYVKPADNCASRGMTRLTSVKGLEQAVQEAIEACFSVKMALIEKESPGDEYSVDTVLYKGILYPAGISDRIFQSKERYAVQIGSRTPSLLPTKIQDAMYTRMDAAARALGVTDGAFKGDLVVNKAGEVEIIEVTARTSGGHDSQLRKPLSFGIDLMKCTMDIALGKPLDPLDLIPRWVKWSSTFAIFPTPGIVKEIAGLKETQALPGVADVTLLIKVGDCIEPYTHSAKRTNFITCVADTYEQLLALEEKIRHTLHIETVQK